MQTMTLAPLSGPAGVEPSLPRLYTFRRCPYAMRARMALLQAGRDFEAVEVSLRDKPAALLALSPKGTVPVLQLPGGEVIEESWDIMRWALTAPDENGWWARAQSHENLDLVRRNDGAFKHHLDRWKYPQRYVRETAAPGPNDTQGEPDATGALDAPGAQHAIGAEEAPPLHRDCAVEVLLRPLEDRLRTARFLGGDQACATDLAVFPFVRQFAAVDPAWFATLALPSLRAWLNDWLASDLFIACMHKLPAEGPIRFPA